MFTEADTYAAFTLYQLREAELRADAERRRVVNAARKRPGRSVDSPRRDRWLARFSRAGRHRPAGESPALP
jgi:hypothetical protein